MSVAGEREVWPAGDSGDAKVGRWAANGAAEWGHATAASKDFEKVVEKAVSSGKAPSDSRAKGSVDCWEAIAAREWAAQRASAKEKSLAADWDATQVADSAVSRDLKGELSTVGL